MDSMKGPMDDDEKEVMDMYDSWETEM